MKEIESCDEKGWISVYLSVSLAVRCGERGTTRSIRVLVTSALTCADQFESDLYHPVRIGAYGVSSFYVLDVFYTPFAAPSDSECTVCCVLHYRNRTS
jgi:hypothetical protein